MGTIFLESWNRNRKLQNMTQNELNKRVSKIIERFTINANNELKTIWNNLEIDLTKKEIYEVLIGLIARQITLATHFMRCPNLWTGNLGPLILRSMIDNYINFVYYVKKELRNVLLNFDNTGEINIDNLKKKLNSNTSNKALKIKRKLMLEILKIKVK